MSVWTTPITWTNGAVTAATMNAEIRDHLNHLKGALDLITDSTTADTGTATYIGVVRASAIDAVLRGRVSGDTQPRIELTPGYLSFGPGGGTAVDAKFERTSANTIRGNDTAIGSARASAASQALQALVTGDSVVRWTALASGAHQWSSGGAAADIELSRGAAGRLELSSAGTSNQARLRIASTAGQQSALEVMVAGDAAVRARLSGDATTTELALGTGATTALKVVGLRQTGWAAATGTATRTTFATGTVTTAQLAERVKALIDDLMTHGLIGA
jgi:hypothetical protein